MDAPMAENLDSLILKWKAAGNSRVHRGLATVL